MRYPTTSKTLIDKLRDRNSFSWDDFYSRYQGIIIDVGHSRGLTEDECNDLVQEVMLRFFQRLKTFSFNPDIAKFRTYFSRIITGKIIDIIRKRMTTFPDMLSQDESILGIHPPLQEEIDKYIFAEWRKLILQQAKEILKNKVDAKTYQAFELYAEQQRDIRKVSEALGMSPNQIYVAKNRCIKMLNKILREMNKADPDLELSL